MTSDEHTTEVCISIVEGQLWGILFEETEVFRALRDIDLATLNYVLRRLGKPDRLTWETAVGAFYQALAACQAERTTVGKFNRLLAETKNS